MYMKYALYTTQYYTTLHNTKLQLQQIKDLQSQFVNYP